MSISKYTFDYGGRQVQHSGDRAPMVRHVLLDAAWFDRLGLPGAPAGAWFAPRASALLTYSDRPERFHARLPSATLSAMANGCPAPLVLLR